jgi:hypothetical protein
VDPVSGGLAPETISWQIDFAPLEVSEPGFIGVSLDPEPAAPEEAVSRLAEGTLLTIGLHPAAWQEYAAPGRTLRASLSTSVQLDLAGDLALEIPFASAAGPATAGAIQLAGSEVSISDEGIEIGMLIGGTAITPEQLLKVQLDSSNLLLALNAKVFTAEVDPAPELGSTAVRLRLVRDAATLTDLSYALLQEELLESEAVELTLTWPDLGESVSGTVRFLKSDSGPAEEGGDKTGGDDDQH